MTTFLDQREIRLLIILTGRATEYFGIGEQHEYNDICGRFYTTIHEEFCAIACRNKIHWSIEEL